MIHILITGATGFIGKNIVQGLLEQADKISLLVRKQSLDKAREMYRSSKIQFISGDITQSGVVDHKSDLARMKDITKVIHVAASYNLADKDFNAFDSNIVGTQNMVKLLDELPKIEYFFYISSYVVNGDKAQSYGDDDLEDLSRDNEIYSLTKNRSERLVREVSQKRSIKTVIFRPGIVLGSTMDERNFKPDGPYFFIKFLMQKKNLIQRMEFMKFLPFYFKELSPLPFVSIDYLTEWITEVVLHPIERPLSTYHLFDQRPITTQEFMDMVSQHFKLGVRITPISVGGAAFAGIFTYFDIPKNLLKYMNLSATYRAEKLFVDFPHLKTYSFKEHADHFFRTAEKGMA